MFDTFLTCLLGQFLGKFLSQFLGQFLNDLSLPLNCTPELPEEAVSDVLVVERALQQELHEVALEEALVLEGLEAIVYK